MTLSISFIHCIKLLHLVIALIVIEISLSLKLLGIDEVMPKFAKN